ncbi:MAG TPA: coproporphyrinogen dehydrogenase HemZ [Syntrophomonadaceae bacterium]|nr:coproporphyrinogen dehydrogenase HemZ [Syntrophomonadaceae bacterium]HPR93120.1 coproporphyrinogen dehydrogenase HemZ [Syntrophomonadaceae bacterium]
MLIAARLKPAGLYETVHEIIRMAYPGGKLTLEQDMWQPAEVHFTMELTEQNGIWHLYGQIESNKPATNRTATYSPADGGAGSALKQLKIDIKIFCLQLLREHLDSKISSYGILTGVRPVKIVHRWLDQGYSRQLIVKNLKTEFLVDEAKAELLAEVAENNRSYLPVMQEGGGDVSIYIGIPYCPSRCYYCSFPGAVLNNYVSDIRPFMDNLSREMNAIGNYVNDAGLKVHTVYIGGGTPTVLDIRDLGLIFEILENKFTLCQAEEITVEAGRPDTLTPDKLNLFKDAGVTRICINPQTMKESTLALIGRRHSVQQVMQAADLVRRVGIKHMNMDLIIGLPEEKVKDNLDSLEQVLKLKPDNITIHTLALKRGSPMALDGEETGLPRQAAEKVEESLENIYQRLRQLNYLPYYLYRQKNTQANTENIGYSLKGSFCIYNIRMIEERQTIIGMGGGAGSKFIDSRLGTVTGFYNPKNPAVYCAEVDRLIKRKVDNLRALN